MENLYGYKSQTTFSHHDERISGRWRAALSGTCIKNLTTVDHEWVSEFWLQSNGKAQFTFPNQKETIQDNSAASTMLEQWSIVDGRTLTIQSPVPPMPEYGIEEWSENVSQYDIMILDADQMLLNDRPFDGELITLYERFEEAL